MQEHFIPQDISNYRFHLIGELDLQQFLEILIGVGIAIIIYQFNWPGIIKWPLMIFFAGIGLIAAFIPIADQPLSHWIKVFLKNLFAPTKFYWRKENAIPAYFLYELQNEYADALKTQETFNASPVKRHKAIDYFNTLGQESALETDRLETFNQERMQSVLQDFATSPEPKVVIKPKKIIRKPSIQDGQSVRIRPIIVPTNKDVNDFLDSGSFFKPTQVTTKITNVEPSTNKHNLNWPQAAKTSSSTESQPTTTQNNTVAKEPQKDQAATSVIKPQLPKVSIEKTPTMSKPQPPIIAKPTNVLSSQKNRPTTPLKQEIFPTAATNKETPVPNTLPAANSTPELIENPEEKSMLIRGKVTDKNGQLLTNVILSLKDSNNNLKFILRSDDHGEFNSDRALSVGKYILSAQKDLLIFPELLIDLDNQGIAPILLKAN